uniref:Uncharacterized protein n=1 Tax=Arundo donax TaxID=35708 RepID=A0A0A9EBX7_ARUDO
MRRRIRSTR